MYKKHKQRAVKKASGEKSAPEKTDVTDRKSKGANIVSQVEVDMEDGIAMEGDAGHECF